LHPQVLCVNDNNSHYTSQEVFDYQPWEELSTEHYQRFEQYKPDTSQGHFEPRIGTGRCFGRTAQATKKPADGGETSSPASGA
jgi:hypothetical protein